MDPESIDALIEEIRLASVPVSRAIEGGEHVLEQMDLLPGTRLEATALLSEYVRRWELQQDLVSRLNGVRSAIDALNEHGYPDEPSAKIHPDAVGDVGQNLDTIEYFFSRLGRTEPTVTGTFEAGQEEAG